MLEIYLAELRRELSRQMPAEDVQARLVEVDAHLREGIEGRCELGLDAAAAERETIASFGSARDVARSLTATVHSSRIVPRMRWIGVGLTISTLFFLVGPSFFEVAPTLNLVFFWAFGLCVAGFAVAAFRSRRPAPTPVVLSVLAGGVFTWLLLGVTWQDLTPYGGLGYVPPGEGQNFIDESSRMAADREADQIVFDTGWAILTSPLGIEGLRESGGYLAPVVQPVSYNQRPQYTLVKSAGDARHAWIDMRQRGRNLFDSATMWSNVRAIRQAQRHPVTNIISFAPTILTGGAGLAAAIGVIDLTFAGLGALIFSIRRRGRSRGIIV